MLLAARFLRGELAGLDGGPGSREEAFLALVGKRTSPLRTLEVNDDAFQVRLIENLLALGGAKYEPCGRCGSARSGNTPRPIFLYGCPHTSGSVGTALAIKVALLRRDCKSLAQTGKHPLELHAECALQLCGLASPAQDQGTSLADCDAVRLFVDRSSRTQIGFSLSPQNKRDVLRICRLLDGVPQAIELAAAWAGTMGIAEIVSTLEHQPECLSMFFGDFVGGRASSGLALAH